MLGGLCVALLQREGLVGLAAGVCAYRQLAEAHLAELFPPARKRGRAGAFAWLTQRLTAAFDPLPRRVPPTSTPCASAPRTSSAWRGVVNRELGEMRAATGAIKSAFATLIEQAAPPPPPPPPPEPPPPEPTPEPFPEPAPEPAPGDRPRGSRHARGRRRTRAGPPRRALPDAVEDAEQAAALFELLH